MTPRQGQIERVKAALVQRESVDQVTAFRQGWGLRLSSLIYRLRCRGWPILTQQDRNNGLARYRLPEGWHPPNPTPETAVDKEKPR